MNKKITRKSAFLFFASISLGAFLFVNIHANIAIKNDIASSLLIEEKVEQKEDKEHKAAGSNIALIGKVVYLLQRFIPSMY